MTNESIAHNYPPGADVFLRKIGIKSLDSDFSSLRRQLDEALAQADDYLAPPPYRWEDGIIESLVSDGDSVLDLGCGDGELLFRLGANRLLRCQGVERDEQSVLRCLERGIPVYQGDLQRVLATIQDGSFTFAILERTLQTLPHPVETLREMLRVAKHCVVSFPNFAHWSVRLAVSLGGRMPVTGVLPYSWYDTPNIHLCSITDFLDWVSLEGVIVRNAWVLAKKEIVPFIPSQHNITTEEALFVLERQA